jgi:uncharacterized membrane protein
MSEPAATTSEVSMMSAQSTNVNRDRIRVAAVTCAIAIALGSQIATSREVTGRDCNRRHGFVSDNGVFTTIDAPRAGLDTVALVIDDRGRTVGGYVDDRGRLHGFLQDNEAFTVIDVPGAATTFVSKINAQGKIVGAYSRAPNTPLLQAGHGFLLEDGVFKTIDVPGAVPTQPFGINNRGRIVGTYSDKSGLHGFLLSNGAFTTLTIAGTFEDSIAVGINDEGRIVGLSF